MGVYAGQRTGLAERISGWSSDLDPREPGSQALDLEGVPGLGDSGGPALLETGSAPIIMGIAVGELEQGPSPAHQGLYGATQLYERISTHMDWIEQVMSAQ